MNDEPKLITNLIVVQSHCLNISAVMKLFITHWPISCQTSLVLLYILFTLLYFYLLYRVYRLRISHGGEKKPVDRPFINRPSHLFVAILTYFTYSTLNVHSVIMN